MIVTFKNCWVGCYVGNGEYEGGTFPNLTLTRVPNDLNEEDIDQLFVDYVNLVNDTCMSYDEDEKQYRVTHSYITGKKPIKIFRKHELMSNLEQPYLEIDYERFVDLCTGEVLYEIRYRNKPTKLVTCGEYDEIMDDIIEGKRTGVQTIYMLDSDGYIDKLLWSEED